MDTRLEQLVEEIMQEHLERLDLCQTIPLERRGRRKRKRPQTAIIADAAKRIEKAKS